MRNCSLTSFLVDTGSTERMMEMALQVSQKSVVTTIMPETGLDGKCRIWCNPPSEQLPLILRLVRSYHRGRESPVFGLIDVKATREVVQPGFCGFDWRSFDPVSLSWQFNGEGYMEKLKRLKVQRSQSWLPTTSK